MMGGFFDDRKSGQECLQVQPQMHLCGGFAPSMLCPIHAVGNQCNSRRVNGVDRLLESAGKLYISPRRTESGKLSLKC
jgi:hypothetical protein